MDRNNDFIFFNITQMHYGKLPVPYGSMLYVPPTNLLLLAAKQEPYKKAYLLTKNIEEFSGEKIRRMGQQVEKKMRQKE